MFFGDDDPTLWIKRKQVARLPPELKELYQDFCIFQGDQIGCPSHFNRLTVAWYLNESPHPNVRCDKVDYAFYALRNIKTGEELTLDYSSFSAPPQI
jgi:SET domain